MTTQTIAVWFSCGAASAVAAKKTLEIYGATHTIKILNTPIDEEHIDNRRFLHDVQDWLGTEITSVTSKHGTSAEAIWRKRRYMSGPRSAPCTLMLKKEARYEWEYNNPHDALVLGFTADEKHRIDRFRQSEMTPLIPVLADLGLTKKHCFEILKKEGIRVPEMYRYGYPNANCIGCVKASSVTYWNHVRKNHPEVFEARAKLSREIGCKLVIVKGQRVFLDSLSPEAKGNKMRNDFDCSAFCEDADQNLTTGEGENNVYN